MKNPHGPLRVGVGGPVGSGKTALMDALCKKLRESYEIYPSTAEATQSAPSPGSLKHWPHQPT